MGDLVQVVLGQDDGHPQAAVQVGDRLHHQPFPLRVQVAQRLVQQQHLGLHRQRGSDGQELLLASRKARGEDLPPILDAQQSQRLPQAGADLRAGEAEVLQPEGDFILDGELGNLRLRVLEDHTHHRRQFGHRGLPGVPSGHAHPAGEAALDGLGDEPVDGHQQRALAAPRRAAQDHEFAPLHP